MCAAQFRLSTFFEYINYYFVAYKTTVDDADDDGQHFSRVTLFCGIYWNDLLERIAKIEQMFD